MSKAHLTICSVGDKMSLYNLVSLKHALTKQLDITPVVSALEDLKLRLANIEHQVPEIDEVYQAHISALIKQYDDLVSVVATPVAKNNAMLTQLTNEITDIAHRLFANSYELEEHNGGLDHVRSFRRINLAEDVEQVVKQRILLHTNWRYPALEIGCRDGEWTQYLVAADPLYIMDQFPEFLDSANSRFPVPYQNRLRKYALRNHDLGALPKNQFAFVFSWGHFNYVSLDTITQVLKQLTTVLRPGGVFMFSYNDGDTPAGAGMAENFAQTYIPKSLLIPTCLSMGYEIASEFFFEPNVSWLEVRRPGELHTVKMHQAMGKITARTD